MSHYRNVYDVFSKVLSINNAINRMNLTIKNQAVCLNHARNYRSKIIYKRSSAQVLKIMKARRTIAGPDRVRKRNEWYGWNYNAELYAFNKRLHENLTETTLRTIFVHDSYVRMEVQKRKEMDLGEIHLDIQSNSYLAERGESIMSDYILRYLRHAFQYVPEEGIIAVHDFLISEDVLSHVSFNIGTKDLIFCAEYPPEKNTLAIVLKALIGGIATDDSVGRAENFVLDFVCPQLIGKDLFEIWEFDKPLQILNCILQKDNRESTESRLIFESGRNTIESVYHVGLYSSKQILGRGVGETLIFAEEMAAYDALRRIFHLTDSKEPVPLGEAARKIEFNLKKRNITLEELCGQTLEKIKIS